LVKEINAQSSLWTAGESFLLEADFVTQLHKSETGHFTWRWSSNSQWEQETTLADFHQITVKKGDETYTARNLKFTPLPVREILEVLNAPRLQSNKWDIGRAKIKQHDAEDCLELRSSAKGDVKREICIASDSKRVVSDETSGDAEVRLRQFSDYQPFLGSSIPRMLKLTIDGVPVLTVVVTLLEKQSYPAAGFVAPANAIVRRTCANMVHPKAIKMPSPEYPTGERVNATSIVVLTVLPDGSVSDVYLVGSSYQGMDKVTQQIVKTWKFKPAMCDGEPVTADIYVQVNFRSR